MLGRSIGLARFGVFAVFAMATPAFADHAVGEAAPDVTEQILAPPATYKATGVQVDEHLNQALPLDAAFRTHDGDVVTLGELLRKDAKPTILTFNYADCPLLCSMQLNGLTAAMPQVADPKTGVALRVGDQYRIITISLEPFEVPGPASKLTKMRARYLERLPEAQRASADRGWTYLVPAVRGDDTQIRRVADAVGFRYNYIPERAEWAHPAAFIFVGTNGRITRYVYGFEVEPNVLRESLLKAGMAESATAAGFMHLCYFYDPDASNHSRAGVMALRIGAAGFVVLLAAGFGVLLLLRRTAWNRTRNIGTLDPNSATLRVAARLGEAGAIDQHPSQTPRSGEAS